MGVYYRELDPELQPYLARDALRGLNSMLAQMPPGEVVSCDHIGAVLRLIEQATTANPRMHCID